MRRGASEESLGDCPASAKTRFSLRSKRSRARSAYIVSLVYEARFKPFTLAFTLLMLLRLRSLQNAPRDAYLATTLDVLLRWRRDQRVSPVGLRTGILFYFPYSPHTSLLPSSFLSLNPRYLQVDHLGNLSSWVNSIPDPDEAWKLNDLSRDISMRMFSQREIDLFGVS